MNAVKHGFYAAGAGPITTGVLQEDPADVEESIWAVVGGLHPRDSVERRQALEIARLYLQLARVDTYESKALESAGRFSSEQRQLLGDEDFHGLRLQITEWIGDVLYGEPNETETTRFRLMTLFLVQYANADKELRSSRGKWDPKQLSDPDFGGREDFFAVLSHFWPKGDVETWLRPIRSRLMLTHGQSHGRLAEAAVARALDTLDRTVTLSGRVGGQLLRAWAVYERLQARDLEEGSPNELT